MLPIPAPMLAVPGDPPEGSMWAREFKWDGVRAGLRVEDGSCTIISRNGRALTASFPDICHALLELTGRRCILDGEIVAPHPATGVPNFGRLQHRLGARPTPQRLAATPTQIFLFDLTWLDDRSTMMASYLERRELLDSLGLESPTVRTPPYFLADPAGMLEVAASAQVEGIVSKRTDSRYRPGRHPTWVKHPIRRTTEGLILAALPGRAHRDTFGALALGAYDQHGQLVYIGSVGTGFSSQARRAIRAALDDIARDTSPLPRLAPKDIEAQAYWVEPVIVADIRYREFAGVLRHASFRGIRPDRDPTDVTIPI
ncbi:non-homologous end-joining DNA ligase [Nocardia amamiensis]|uniref:non-homologous end-joining DNA ligase n=1 Tax=Nocardia amamiensis TaxID=404578 RepID=UPI0009FBAD38|nr:non-homologous end-joining DNA ligase [Nocardia amamiensis]